MHSRNSRASVWWCAGCVRVTIGPPSAPTRTLWSPSRRSCSRAGARQEARQPKTVRSIFLFCVDFFTSNIIYKTCLLYQGSNLLLFCVWKSSVLLSFIKHFYWYFISDTAYCHLHGATANLTVLPPCKASNPICLEQNERLQVKFANCLYTSGMVVR